MGVHAYGRHFHVVVMEVTSKLKNHFSSDTLAYVRVITAVRLGADVVSSSPAARQFFFIYIFFFSADLQRLFLLL